MQMMAAEEEAAEARAKLDLIAQHGGEALDRELASKRAQLASLDQESSQEVLFSCHSLSHTYTVWRLTSHTVRLEIVFAFFCMLVNRSLRFPAKSGVAR